MEQHLKPSELSQLIEIFRKLTGIRYSREKLYLFENRLAKYVGDNRQYPTYSEFIIALEQNRELRNSLINSLTTNYTYFFREDKHFRFLRYILQHKFQDEMELRLWSAAASGGHEAYSMAISLLGRHSDPRKSFKILATDIASEKIASAKLGLYNNEDIEGHITEESIKKFFLKTSTGYQVKDFVKNHINFSILNIMGPYPFKKEFHVIFLRNILIYFKPEEKELILNKISNYLHPQGYLVISLSESLTGLNTPFKHVTSGIHTLK